MLAKRSYYFALLANSSIKIVAWMTANANGWALTGCTVTWTWSTGSKWGQVVPDIASGTESGRVTAWSAWTRTSRAASRLMVVSNLTTGAHRGRSAVQAVWWTRLTQGAWKVVTCIALLASVNRWANTAVLGTVLTLTCSIQEIGKFAGSTTVWGVAVEAVRQAETGDALPWTVEIVLVSVTQMAFCWILTGNAPFYRHRTEGASTSI